MHGGEHTAADRLERLDEILDDFQRRIVIAYWHERKTQRQIAREFQMSKSGIQYRMANIVEALRVIGVELKTRSRGRPAKTRTVSIDPENFERLAARGPSERNAGASWRRANRDDQEDDE